MSTATLTILCPNCGTDHSDFDCEMACWGELARMDAEEKEVDPRCSYC
jgi:hypothetical protein